jgi:hypothetical protein
MTLLLRCLLELRARQPAVGLLDASLLKTDDNCAALATDGHAGPPTSSAVLAGATSPAIERAFSTRQAV